MIIENNHNQGRLFSRVQSAVSIMHPGERSEHKAVSETKRRSKGACQHLYITDILLTFTQQGAQRETVYRESISGLLRTAVSFTRAIFHLSKIER